MTTKKSRFAAAARSLLIPDLTPYVRRIREAMELSRVDLYTLTGISPHTIEAWEKGRAHMSRVSMMQLRRWLNRPHVKTSLALVLMPAEFQGIYAHAVDDLDGWKAE